MTTLYRANFTVPTTEADIVLAILRSSHTYAPSDAWGEDVDADRNIAFFSNDAVACEAINAEINSRREASLQAYDDALSLAPDQDGYKGGYTRAEAEAKGWGFYGYKFRLRRGREITLTGWTKVN